MLGFEPEKQEVWGREVGNRCPSMFDKTAEDRTNMEETQIRGNVRADIEAPHLQLLHLARPATAFLTVDAADRQCQDLLLQLWVRVDLKKENRKIITVVSVVPYVVLLKHKTILRAFENNHNT